ncbi:L-glutaminase [Scopulibacillus darangshiensis]|uniref:Glutaminase n=1 Tax=Scopulibacillus darangshiensis TaxID=442528 RepID=A0A4R2PCE7_9BACL|nr:glutaminase A [Scopulibacillus darangshiensis]TCP31761.1 L-glutaminase [Scopulibacillus darangshiensis]
MYCETSTELEELVERARPYTSDGKVADYIPALGKADPKDLSIAIHHLDGKCLSAGDVEKTFTLQSISKILTLALVIMDHGVEYVFSKVGMEPTGDPFNSIAKLEESVPSRPLNPMINAGALAVTNMIHGSTVHERLGRLLALIHDMTENSSIRYSEEVATSEYKTADLNRALCYFMKQHDVITGDVEELMDLYTKQCAIEVNCHDLARIGLVIANNGKDPQSGRIILPKQIARIVKTFMSTCGMYNASGEFAIKVGIPSKSGVSGGIISAFPNKFGVGIYGPSLDDIGNSIAGIKLLEMLSARYELSIF